MKVKVHLYVGDSKKVLRQFPTSFFEAACFSPPYSPNGDKGAFDCRKDFEYGGRFLPYVREIDRVCKVWAINISQRTHNGNNLLYIEKFILEVCNFSNLLDRWVIVRPVRIGGVNSIRPSRDWEYLLLFAKDLKAVQANHTTELGTTIYTRPRHQQNTGGVVGTRPYSEEIPIRVFTVYGNGGPVLDPFCGTGTTLKVAADMGLESYGVELFPKIATYCESRLNSHPAVEEVARAQTSGGRLQYV